MSILFTSRPSLTLDKVLSEIEYDRKVLIVPTACKHLLIPFAGEWRSEEIIEIDDREAAKTPAQAETIWKEMLRRGLTRHSIAVNLGGGVTTDLGSFAASCYMRGIRSVNVPTTLLAMVDASSGGKTGVNVGGVKNIAGTFHVPLATIICTKFLSSLPASQILSGYGEMLKHALLMGDTALSRALEFDFSGATPSQWRTLVRENVRYKEKITRLDPEEKGLRRILNLGHTAGHAFEALCLMRGKGVTHGQAVAQGLVCTLVLSNFRLFFPAETLQRFASYVREVFPPIYYDCKDYGELLSLMHSDKKNIADARAGANFTLLSAPGNPQPGIFIPDEEIGQALDITRDLIGI